MKNRPVQPEVEALHYECHLFTRYLVGQLADTYVLAKYVDLQPTVVKQPQSVTRLDAVLLRIGCSSLLGLRIADAYARTFRPRCLLRRKLILTFAILENSGRFFSHFTSGVSASCPLALIRVALSLTGFVLALAASMFVIVPFTMLIAWQSGKTRP